MSGRDELWGWAVGSGGGSCLNERAYGSNFIRHSELCEGARLEFTMSDQANY